MKKIIIFIVLIINIFSKVSIEDANLLFEKEDYNEALKMYLELVNKGNGDAFFYLGMI